MFDGGWRSEERRLEEYSINSWKLLKWVFFFCVTSAGFLFRWLLRNRLSKQSPLERLRIDPGSIFASIRWQRIWLEFCFWRKCGKHLSSMQRRCCCRNCFWDFQEMHWRSFRSFIDAHLCQTSVVQTQNKSAFASREKPVRKFSRTNSSQNEVLAFYCLLRSDRVFHRGAFGPRIKFLIKSCLSKYWFFSGIFGILQQTKGPRHV